MEAPYSQELELACTIVHKAALLTKKLLSSVDKGAISKDDLSPVTVGDFAVQALLTRAIISRFPEDGLVGEEDGDTLRQNSKLTQRVWELLASMKDDCERGELPIPLPSSPEEMIRMIDLGGRGRGGRVGRVWVFDPIDGTLPFMRGEQYAINLALLVDGKEQLGVIGCPCLPPDAPEIRDDLVDAGGYGCIVYAVRGCGAFMRPMSESSLQEPRMIPRHAENVPISGLRFCDCTTTTSTILPLHRKVAEKLNACWPGAELWSSLMKYAILGLGPSNTNIRIFKFRHYKSNIWDHAGGALIFEEVGGKITDLDGKELDFGIGRKMSQNYGFVAAPRDLHHQVLSVVQTVMAEAGLEVDRSH